jgi:hypothetical protein
LPTVGARCRHSLWKKREEPETAERSLSGFLKFQDKTVAFADRLVFGMTLREKAFPTWATLRDT